VKAIKRKHFKKHDEDVGTKQKHITKFICARNHDCSTCPDNDKCPEGKEKAKP
jgi:hypothetical protein